MKERQKKREEVGESIGNENRRGREEGEGKKGRVKEERKERGGEDGKWRGGKEKGR